MTMKVGALVIAVARGHQRRQVHSVYMRTVMDIIRTIIMWNLRWMWVTLRSVVVGVVVLLVLVEAAAAVV